jgi:hypothetical protein
MLPIHDPPHLVLCAHSVIEFVQSVGADKFNQLTAFLLLAFH